MQLLVWIHGLVLILMGSIAYPHKNYNYYPQFQLKQSKEHFHRVNNAFSMLISKELQGDIGLQSSPEATCLISTYGSFIIQCPQFTYIYIGGFQDCLSSFDAQNIDWSTVNISLHSFHSWFPFDGNKYVKNNLALGPCYLHFPTMEDYWENCENDYKVRRRDWMIFILQQIIDYKMGWNVIDIKEDQSDLIDPFFFMQIQLLEWLYINQSLPKLKDLKERTLFFIQWTENWLNNKVK